MIRLSLTDMTFAADGVRLLGPITEDINLSGVTAILGPNGAGKTLFLQACHGSLPATTGAASWDGRDARATRPMRGYVAQRPTVLRRSVADNVAYAVLAQSGSVRDRHAIDAVLRDAGLLDLADRPAAALSGGELRRMAMARALVTRPSALLLDEPFNGLDPQNHRALERMLRRVQEQGVPVLMISHNLPLARQIADQVIFVDAGQILTQETAQQFFNRAHSGTIADYLDGHLV